MFSRNHPTEDPLLIPDAKNQQCVDKPYRLASVEPASAS